nr:immunoglobulin heavy chain junction region [Macaca mulatta]MOW98221.1 immunoglobulin heavy chain junction region [Macaca mulatta]MOW98330.1 immunoglobulin heavy chain junction region [Macaca mulatta]MOW99391.1 immunoglobulin heavy chain junction region [Macaca mulatta]MOW99480.1 immunoglobulin heavy chain junction region [Macaca mulatta]
CARDDDYGRGVW